jgi:hypothetical protein
MVGGAAAGGRVGGEADAGSNESGQVGIGCAGVTGSSSSDGGGQAGIALSVGGSGGQMSVSSGGAGAESVAGGHVDLSASAATALSGSVSGLSSSGSSAEAAGSASGSASGSPDEVGTVVAQPGVAPDASPLGELWVFDQSGSPFCMGRAGMASSTSGEAVASAAFSAGSTGTVWAQTGVVSLVGTASTGSSETASGGVELADARGSDSKSSSV